MKYGRLPRAINPAIPHWSALRLQPGITLPAAPASISYVRGIPGIGMFGNDRWGCCAFAAAAHYIQVWAWNATGKMPAITTDQVLQGYSEVTGFDINAGPPGQNPTDRGTVLQDMLAWWLNKGFPLADGTRHKIRAYFELDPRQPTDLNLATAECGAVLCGINVPAYLQQLEAPGSLWTLQSANAQIVGGHAITSAGYAATGDREVETWGSTDYAMTAGFVEAEMPECYGIVSDEFMQATGKTPYGLPLAVWEQQMSALGAPA
ncbi:MAG: hypothetical protein M0Z84_09610 [Gammaproteobacteria bacterium]|nr:hypothetical protein [Gammaproteobacteria bacterium]